LAATEKSARDLLDGAAPFLLCPRTGGHLVRQLEAERALREWEIGRVHAVDVAKTILARLIAPKNRARRFADKTFEWVARTIGDVEEELAAPPEKLRGAAIAHGVSELDQQHCAQTLQIAAPALARRFSLDAKRLIALEGELRECRSRLNRLPEAK